MKRVIKIGLSIIGSVIALIFITLISIIGLVNPNHYKAQIASYLSQVSGRNLIIEGDIRFTLYPWLGLGLGKIRFGNPPGFTEPTLVQVEQAQFQVKLLPLLTKQIEVGQVLLAGMKLTLIRKADGHTNWEDLLALTGKSEPTAATNFFEQLKIAGLKITQGELTWDDRQTRSRYVFSDFNLNTSAIIFNQPIDLKLHSAALAIAGKTTLQGQLDLTTQLTVNLAQQLYQLTPLKLVATLVNNQISLGQQSLSLYTKIALDLKQQNFMVSLLSLQLLGIDLSGQVNIHNRLSSPTMTGQVAVTPFNPQKLWQRLKQAQLGLAWASLFNQPGLSFQSARLKTQFQFNPVEGIKFNNLELQVDNNSLKTQQLNLDWQKETLATKTLSLTAVGITLNAQVKIEQLFSQPAIQGQLSLLPFNPNATFEQLKLAKVHLPAISLPNQKILPLQTAGLTTQFQWQDNQLDLTNLHWQVDNNHFQTAHLQINLSQETLAANEFSFQAWEMKLVGKMQVKQLLSQPQATAEIAIAPFNLPVLFKRLGITPPSLPKPLTLTQASLTTQLTVTSPNLTLNNLHVTVDENQLTVQQAQFNWVQNILNLEHFILKVFTVSAQGKLQITQLLAQPKLQGSLKVAQFDPRQLLPRLGQLLPTTADPTVLNRLALETTLQGNLSQLVLDNLKINLDDSQLLGNLEIKKFNPPAINFHLDVDNVDIDRYLPPQSAEKTTQPQPSLPPKETPSPLDFLRALNFNGTLKINHFKAAQLTTMNLELAVAAQQGDLKIIPQVNSLQKQTK